MKIGTRSLTYIIEDIDQLAKINIIQGDSATGKTNFYEECINIERGMYGHSSTNEIPVHSSVGTQQLKTVTPKLCSRDLI